MAWARRGPGSFSCMERSAWCGHISPLFSSVSYVAAEGPCSRGLAERVARGVCELRCEATHSPMDRLPTRRSVYRRLGPTKKNLTVDKIFYEARACASLGFSTCARNANAITFVFCTSLNFKVKFFSLQSPRSFSTFCLYDHLSLDFPRFLRRSSSPRWWCLLRPDALGRVSFFFLFYSRLALPIAYELWSQKAGTQAALVPYWFERSSTRRGVAAPVTPASFSLPDVLFSILRSLVVLLTSRAKTIKRKRKTFHNTIDRCEKHRQTHESRFYLHDHLPNGI